MKYQIFKLALILTAMNIALTACQPATSKENTSPVNAVEAEQELNALVKANAELRIADGNIFQHMAELKIKRNEIDLADLKAKMKTSSLDLNSAYATKLEMLGQKNFELKIKKEAYEQSQNNWDKFKRDYNADLDDLRRSLKELSRDSMQ